MNKPMTREEIDNISVQDFGRIYDRFWQHVKLSRLIQDKIDDLKDASKSFKGPTWGKKDDLEHAKTLDKLAVGLEGIQKQLLDLMDEVNMDV